MPFRIYSWRDIAHEFQDTLLLGNGSSIAVNPSFSYGSLLEHARERDLLAEEAQRLFDFFETQDFELILRIVWQATNVNRSLGIDDAQTRQAYVRVRDCLIQTVQDVHPEHHEVRPQLPAIYRFLRGFKTVVSLNYDLIVYWATTYGLDITDHHTFKDCFLRGGIFAEDWKELRNNYGAQRTNTLVFYPHGGLILCRDRVEHERKIHNGQDGLLHSILQRWQEGDVVPLFVSEGTKQQKVSAIQNSRYFSTVYREVLPSLSGSLVIYGWSMGEQDKHLLDQMKYPDVRRVAVSVHQANMRYCDHAYAVIREALGPLVAIQFFDSASPGCWMNEELAA